MAENKKQKSKKGLIIGCIVAVLVIALIAVSVIAVIKSGLIGEKLLGQNKIKELVGNYDLIEMTEGEEVTTKEDIDLLKKFGLIVSLELREDGTGTLDLFGDTEELNFDDKNITADDEEVPYTFEENKLTMEKEDTKLVFEKITE